MTGQAKPCKNCQGTNFQWKFLGDEVWVHCDCCGNTSTPRMTRSEAGEQWNYENTQELGR